MMQASSEYRSKIDLIAKFTRFAEWPTQSAVRNLNKPFVLGVIGRSPFGDELDQRFLKEPLKGKGVQIRYCRTLDDTDSCDLLFICSSEKDRLSSILARIRQKPILTVSDTAGFAQAGVMVNLVHEGSRLGFEINAAAAKEGGIRFASGFLQIARVVAS
jgi:hypothetical protein